MVVGTYTGDYAGDVVVTADDRQRGMNIDHMPELWFSNAVTGFDLSEVGKGPPMVGQLTSRTWSDLRL